jgi:hypothetical protein
MDQETFNTIQKLVAEQPKPFVTEVDKYGQAIAAGVIAQAKADPAKRLNFEDELRAKVELKGGSYGFIYKGSLPVRLVPFIWSLDQQTRRMWAVFSFNNFYGHKEPNSFAFWKRIKTIIVLTPFDNSPTQVDSFGKGYLAKFDEDTQFQVPLSIQDTQEAQKMRVENKQFISAALSLWMDLQSYTKAKINYKIIMYLIGAAVVIVAAYWFISSHPGFLTALFPHS